MKIEDLPTEILRLFVLRLDSHGDRFNLLQVSRRFYTITLTYLYKRIHVPSKEARLVNSLIQTLLENPWLAQECRELDLGESWSVSTNHGPCVEWFTFAHEQSLKKCLKRICHGKQEELAWLDALQSGQTDAFVAALLISLPCLEKLTIAVPFMEPKSEDGIPSSHFHRTLVRAANQEGGFKACPTLTQLSSVVVMSNPEDEYHDEEYKLAQFGPLLQFPSMQYFTAQKIYDVSNAPWNLQHPSSITHIDLRDSCASSGFSRLISDCPNLKSLTYSHTGREPINGIPRELRKAFQSTSHSLESLILDFRSAFDEFDYGVLGESLSCFQALKVLHIDAYNLLEFEDNFDQDSEFEYDMSAPTIADMIPSSLESLHICALEPQHMQQCFEQLIALASIAGERFPVLSEILLTVKVFVDDEIRDTVKKACAEAGIECRFTLYCGCFERRWGGKNFSWKKYPAA